ncbi:MAG: hypothetical protein QM658_02270 [Gordonia sp. (in: high G+C Gram-positive bacteria)]
MSRRWTLPIAVCSAVLAVVLCVAAVMWRTPAAAQTRSADELSAQAGGIVATVFSASRPTWKADRARARSLTADPFATSSSKALSDGPPDGVQEVRWTPTDVGVVDAQPESGEVLVVVRATVTPMSGAASSQVKSVQARFVRDDGRWLLSGLDELR